MKKPLSPLSPWERVRVRVNPNFILFYVIAFLLSACSSQPESAAPTFTSAPATATSILITETPAPSSAQDLSLFGAIGTNEIQAYALESVASAIFTKIMDSLVANGPIQEYQVTSVTFFPGSGGLLSEITYNVRTTDPVWLEDGGTPAADNWINDKCNRFDFFTTETEYQLKNRRLCG